MDVFHQPSAGGENTRCAHPLLLEVLVTEQHGSTRIEGPASEGRSEDGCRHQGPLVSGLHGIELAVGQTSAM
ncbi:hypothetical protein UK15_16365 [Streptomyces variegatus]|uniref:Uncharacterized protein n=1 Tax=Streptomyces variegatus TaxID=284040 RepID=A0A0M2GT40_9ACTN|nr:hypothetical protein UK15_16365 [Streptomyces variegatus]